MKQEFRQISPNERLLALLGALLLCSLVFAQKPIGSHQELIERLGTIQRYNASADYDVLLPSATDDIVYAVDFQSIAAPSDTLSPCEYLIEWSLDTPSGPSSGFSAYSNASHFRYRDERLQEYHFDWDSIPFLTRDGGVQRNAQFAELLPQNLAVQLSRIFSKPEYTFNFIADRVTGGRRLVVVEAKESYQGYTAREMEYQFDAFTGMPIKIEIESNPGEISEQTVTVKFGEPRNAPVERFAEDALIERYPDVFEKYRRSNFRAENLPGSQLTSFASPTPTGGRFTYNRGEAFHSPTMIVVIDPTVASTEATIADIRNSVAMLPYSINIIWAFVSNNAETIENLLGNPIDGETTVMSVRALTRDSGITTFPTILFVNRDGTIGDIQLGYNKILPEIVMQKTALLK